MAEPTSPPSPIRPTKDDIASAALSRLSKPLSADEEDDIQWAKEKDQRQHFRRLVDPGIVRTNNEQVANGCVDCLVALCQNILDHPEDEKYRKFKPTNKRIQTHLVAPKGGLEYATALGFREHVESFQPYYLWRPTPENVSDLRIGTFVLKEHQAKIVAKEEQSKVVKMSKKETDEDVARRVKLAFEDDRKTRAMRDQMEKQRRLAREAARANSPELPAPTHVAPTSPLLEDPKED